MWKDLSMWKDILKVGFWMIYINTTKLSHRFHTVKTIHFVFFPSKFTHLNQCVRWQFRNHEVFLIYTRFLRGKSVFSRKIFFLCQSNIALTESQIFLKTHKKPIFFQKRLGWMYASQTKLNSKSCFSCFLKTHLIMLK